MRNNNLALIYRDEGVSPLSVRYLSQAFQQHNLAYRLVDASFLIHQNWEQTSSLLVMPGGRDSPYHEALKGKGNQKIRQFVEEGGFYLGICAGAYYGCASFEFEKGYPLEVLGTRELAFYPGMATGPAYGPGQFSYINEAGSRLATLSFSNNTLASAYFNGGCMFPHANTYPTVEVVASYHDLPGAPAAVVKCQVKQGQALLSGVHLEYSSDNFSLLMNSIYRYIV